MAYTQLAPGGFPGGRYSFIAKSVVVVTVKKKPHRIGASVPASLKQRRRIREEDNELEELIKIFIEIGAI